MSEPARTYNQAHASRPYTPGRRRLSIYISWSYPGEAGRDVSQLDNRFSTMTEVRRVTWPDQKIFRTTLAAVADVIEKNHLRPPAVIIVGEVAGG